MYNLKVDKHLHNTKKMSILEGRCALVHLMSQHLPALFSILPLNYKLYFQRLQKGKDITKQELDPNKDSRRLNLTKHDMKYFYISEKKESPDDSEKCSIKLGPQSTRKLKSYSEEVEGKRLKNETSA